MFNGAGAMRSSGLVLRNAVVHTANARKSTGSLVDETGKHGTGDRAMNSPTFPPTASGIQEVKYLRDPAGDKRSRGRGETASFFYR